MSLSLHSLPVCDGSLGHSRYSCHNCDCKSGPAARLLEIVEDLNAIPEAANHLLLIGKVACGPALSSVQGFCGRDLKLVKTIGRGPMSGAARRQRLCDCGDRTAATVL